MIRMPGMGCFLAFRRGSGEDRVVVAAAGFRVGPGGLVRAERGRSSERGGRPVVAARVAVDGDRTGNEGIQASTGRGRRGSAGP